jgi:RHS repeat-associated protein
MQVLGGDSTDFRYDGDGRLVRIDVNGSLRSYFLWDGQNLFAELDALGRKVAEYSYYPGLDNLHALVIGTEPHYAHHDGAGNVVALTDRYQTLKRSRYQLDPWNGGILGPGSLSCGNCDRPQFKGALMFDEVGLYYMRNRWYSPNMGRFISEDPVGLAAGINQYAYAGNDPINRSDPIGLGECHTRVVVRRGVVQYEHACSVAGILWVGIHPNLQRLLNALEQGALANRMQAMIARASTFSWYTRSGAVGYSRGIGVRPSKLQSRECLSATIQSADTYVPLGMLPHPATMSANATLEVAALGALAYDIENAGVAPWRKALAWGIWTAQTGTVLTGSLPPTALGTSIVEFGFTNLSSWALMGTNAGRAWGEACGM